MNVGLMLARSAQRAADRPSVFRGTELLWNYRELHERASGVAHHFRHRLGLQPGARVAVYMMNVPEYLTILFGAWYAGLVVVPVNAKLHPNEVGFVLQDCGASLLCVCGKLEASVGAMALGPGCSLMVAAGAVFDAAAGEGQVAAVVERARDDLAWLFYTSGTTGKPKGVMLSHGNLMAMVSCYFTGVDSVEPGDGVLYAAPLSHGAGLYGLPFVLQGARHILPPSGGFDCDEVLALAAHHRQLVMFAAPTMVKRLVHAVRAAGADPSGIKTIVYGGGPMYAADIRDALSVMGDRFAQIYGQGESPMTITSLTRADLADAAHPRHDHRLASVGSAQALVEVRIADSSVATLPPDTPGEVLVRGETVMLGYWNDPEATGRTVRDGWLFTGDIGSLDADGFLTLSDRSKDVIISGGSNIYPREVEEVLLLHPAVREVSVVGRPHADWGEEVVAFVVIHPGSGATAADLDDVCVRNIARFKRPKDYRFLDSLPKNNYGKVLKTELRQLA
jgi:long-chain acyl-CoA synthetase